MHKRMVPCKEREKSVPVFIVVVFAHTSKLTPLLTPLDLTKPKQGECHHGAPREADAHHRAAHCSGHLLLGLRGRERGRGIRGWGRVWKEGERERDGERRAAFSWF